MDQREKIKLTSGSSSVMHSGSRKPHRKVRTGCRVCKGRKIKCDENKPSCNNCIRHSVQCDIMTTSGAITPAASAISPTPSSDCTSIRTFSPMSAVGLGRSLNQRPLPSISMLNGHTQSFSLFDMELLHHYTTSTCMTLSASPNLGTLWRVNAPQLAYSHEFLMRGLLAIAALHIAYYKPEKRDFYIEKAVAHHQQALSSAVTLLPNVNEENCTVLYLFTAITLLYSIGSPRKPMDFLIVSENDDSDWLSILRGVRAITDRGYETIYKGSLGPMFSAGARRQQLRNDHINHPPNQDLTNLANFLSKSTANPQDLAAYLDSISELQKSYVVLENSSRGTFEPTDMFIWPYQLPDHYLLLLRQRTPGALTIYAYFAVLFKHLDSHWWMKGSAENIISQIYGLLDEEHRLWIRGPIEEIGWVP